MNAFVLESLHPTGWRRSGELFWRFVDAAAAASATVADRDARAVRVLAVTVHDAAVLSLEAAPETAAGAAGGQRG